MVRNGIPIRGEGEHQPEAPPQKRVNIAAAVESIVRCKWSLQVLARIRRGITRPGALVRACPGLSTKVLNERLAKMVRFGILQRVAFPEIPPRVEYHLTELGRSFVKILDAIEELQQRAEGPDASAACVSPADRPAARRSRSGGRAGS
jgi:DNA-binding HxlR family transcriptional regulator